MAVRAWVIADLATGRALGSTVPAGSTRSIFRAERGRRRPIARTRGQAADSSLGATHLALDRPTGCAIVRACQMGFRC